MRSSRAEARAAAVKAARARLNQIASGGAAPEPALASLRASLDRKARRYQQLLDRLETEGDDDARPAHRWRGSSTDSAKGNAMVKSGRPLSPPTVR